MKRKTLIRVIGITWTVAILCVLGIAIIGFHEKAVPLFMVLCFMILFLFGEYEALVQMDSRSKRGEEG